MENICFFWIAISLQNYTLIQLMTLEKKLKSHSEMLKQNFHQIFIRKYIQQVSHPASYTESKISWNWYQWESCLLTNYTNNIKYCHIKHRTTLQSIWDSYWNLSVNLETQPKILKGLQAKLRKKRFQKMTQWCHFM